jgi:hypothetical protein
MRRRRKRSTPSSGAFGCRSARPTCCWAPAPCLHTAPSAGTLAGSCCCRPTCSDAVDQGVRSSGYAATDPQLPRASMRSHLKLLGPPPAEPLSPIQYPVWFSGSSLPVPMKYRSTSDCSPAAEAPRSAHGPGQHSKHGAHTWCAAGRQLPSHSPTLYQDTTEPPASRQPCDAAAWLTGVLLKV